MAGVYGNTSGLEPFGKGYRQHPVGLLGLAVDGSIAIRAAFEFQVVQVQFAAQ